MKCPHCKKKIQLAGYVWLNVESYQRSVLATTECCEKPVSVAPDMRYEIHIPYVGDKIKDDWGVKFKTE